MEETFVKAPLVEIIAELRWEGGGTELPQGRPAGQPVRISTGSTQTDEFFMRFGGRAYALGFERSERIIPQGIPVLVGQPVYRYRPGDNAPDGLMRSALLQVGSGMFSANAVPPYRSWTEFFPVVKDGVRALLETRDDNEKNLPFTTVKLRYIDAFGENLLGGKSPEQFIEEVLGFAFTLPEPLRKRLAARKSPKARLQVTLPLEVGMTMGVSIGEGTFQNEKVVLMDTTVTAGEEVAPELTTIMERFDSARRVIHDSFVEMSHELRDLMQPKEANK